MDNNFEAIKTLIGIKMNQFDILAGLEKVDIDLTNLTDKFSTDKDNNDITDAVGLLLGMDSTTVYEILEYCHRNCVDDYDKIIELLLENKDVESFVIFTKG